MTEREAHVDLLMAASVYLGAHDGETKARSRARLRDAMAQSVLVLDGNGPAVPLSGPGHALMCRGCVAPVPRTQSARTCWGYCNGCGKWMELYLHDAPRRIPVQIVPLSEVKA